MLSNAIIEQHFVHKRPSIWKIAANQTIMLLAPHPDDEVIGAGGALLLNKGAGNDIHIVFVTNGSQGRSRKEDPEATATVRQQEAEAVCASLGAFPWYLNAPDRGDLLHPAIVGRLKELMDTIQPDIILVPHEHDGHRDHFLTNVLLYLALEDAGISLDAHVLSYEVWSPLNANLMLNITEAYERKAELMKLYHSQLAILPYLHMMEGLNQYRASLFAFPTVRYAEAFIRRNVEEYKAAIGKSVPGIGGETV